jgi:hypothetical protein
METYAIWNGTTGAAAIGSYSYSTKVTFPITGTYTFTLSADNVGDIYVDSTPIITGFTNFTSSTTTTALVTSCVHTITLNITNYGGPAGIAARILNPDTSELWNSRILSFSGLTNTTDGGDSADGAASGGGGGGGYFGGLGGTSYGDDSGAAPGGNGGQNYGTITEAGNGTLPGGRTSTFYPLTPPNIGRAGYPGYIVMIFTRKPGLQIKNPDGSGNWVTVNHSYVRTDAPRPGVASDHKHCSWSSPIAAAHPLGSGLPLAANLDRRAGSPDYCPSCSCYKGFG